MKYLIHTAFLLILFSLHPKEGKSCTIDLLKKVVETEDFAKVSSFLKYSEEHCGIEVLELVDKEISANRYETTIEFVTHKPSDDPNIYIKTPIHLNLIRNKTSIIYYELIDYTTANFPKLVSKSNLDKKLDSLHYHFTDYDKQITYGGACGESGVYYPFYSKQLNYLTEEKDTSTLKKWLLSSVSEIQVYAINGFYQLSKKGIKLNNGDLIIIRYIKSKRGSINSCSGCIFYHQSIEEATKDFIFD